MPSNKFLKANLGKAEVKKAWAAECFLQPVPEATSMCRVSVSVCLPVCIVYVGGRAPETRDVPPQGLRGLSYVVSRSWVPPDSPVLWGSVFLSFLSLDGDLMGQHVGSGGGLTGSRSQLSH